MMKTKALVWDQVDKAQIPLDRLVEEYLLVCRTEGKSPKTIRGYREKLGRFCRWLNGNLGDFTLQAMRTYIGELQGARKYEGHPYSPVQDAGLSSLTIKGHVVVLKGFATWLCEEEYTGEDVLGRLKPPKAARKVMATLSESEVSKILSSIERGTLIGHRNEAIVLLLLDTGLRCAELVGLRIIQFFDEFGAEATRKAFDKSRSTIYLWKQKLRKANGRIAALAPGSKAPIHRRRRIIPPFIEAFILTYRTDHPGADKTTIAPVLASACNSAGIRPVSESTVGRTTHDLKEKGRLPKSTKITINARTGKLLVREHRKPRQKQRRKGFCPTQPGDIVQMDTVSIFACGIKRYIFTAIDVSTRFAFACTYPSNSSANGRDFLRKFVTVAPFNTARIQTDNGGEFEKHFDKACQEYDLVHFFNYPRHPRSNSYLERFNRTIQEQFVYWHIDYLDELNDFNAKMMEYLVWYNTEKPHRGIGNLSPLRYYIDNFLIPPQKSNMLWTLTQAIQCSAKYATMSYLASSQMQ